MSVVLAMIGLKSNNHIKTDLFMNQFSADWENGDKIQNIENKDNTFSFEIGISTIFISLMPAPLPTDEILIKRSQFLSAEEKSEILKGTSPAHLIVVIKTDLPPIEKHLVLTQVCASLCASQDHLQTVYWCQSESFIGPKIFQDITYEDLKSGPPMLLWLNIVLGYNEQGALQGYTKGLKDLGFLDMEIRQTTENPDETMDRLHSIAYYMVIKNILINDGDTIGETDTAMISVSHVPSNYFENEKIILINFNHFN